jgi:hypothetical protein
MLGHDASGHSLILTSMENQVWLEKGDRVVEFGPKILRNIDVGESQAIQGSGMHHGFVQDCKTPLQNDSKGVGWEPF